MNERQLEKHKLKETLEIIHETLNEEKQELKDLYNTFIGNRDELLKVAEHKKIHISNLETSLDKPYFARIDFTYDDGETHTIYIGKNGVSQKTNIVITDWRAPISSLYYDAEVGECNFEAPDGTIRGIMSLKRQYEIEKGKLIDYFDVDLVDEKFRICTISNQLAKGLEFDAVIINNASEDIYSSSNTLDMKLLYVAITRALHELDIVYTDELSKPLHNLKIRKLVK